MQRDTLFDHLAKLKKRFVEILPVLAVFISFSLPFWLLFSINPKSFERTWTGRTYYLFFLWLALLEAILDWEKITHSRLTLKSWRAVFFAVSSILPTVYIVATQFLGLKSTLSEVVDLLGIPFAPITTPGWTYGEWVLSLEYLVLAALFAAIVWLSYGRDGLKIFSSALFFIGAVGVTYMIDTLYPFGYFTPLQTFVPFTASLAAGVLNWIGYQTAFTSQYMGTPVLATYDSSGRLLVQYAVGWPCAGIQSLLIYTFVMLLFLKKMTISRVQKLIYFIAGALVAYCVNILRIVSIYLTYINNLSQGREAAEQAARMFHSYYGGLYSMTWIIAYPLLVVGTHKLWERARDWQIQFKLPFQRRQDT